MPKAAPSICLALSIVVAACHKQTPAEKAAADARDVAWVEAAQKVKPPLQPVEPQPVSPAVRKVYRLTDAGCDFRAGSGTTGDPVMVAGGVKAVLRVRDAPMVLAADSGSPELAAGVHAKYVGRSHWIELTREPAVLTIHDRFDRVVYSQPGSLTCGALARPAGVGSAPQSSPSEGSR